MKKILRKGISLFMAVLMVFVTGVPALAEEVPLEELAEIVLEEETELYASSEKSLEEIIRPQIEAYAKSIDQKDANKTAADKLALHGMSKRGKDLIADKSHSLTATLFNAKFMQYFLVSVFKDLIITEQETNSKTMFCEGSANWSISGLKYYDYRIFDLIETDYDNYLKKGSLSNYTGQLNAYDSSLVWMAGDTIEYFELNRKEKTAESIVYDIEVVVWDEFDFDTSRDSGFVGLITGLGALLFTEFEWECTLNFTIEVPNYCEHSYEIATKVPTCTEKGRATHTCTLCGCSYTEETPAKGHSIGEWSVYAEPTVGKAGEERRACTNCDYYESKEIAAYRYGDVNCDGKVNTIDANYVRRYAAGLLTLDERQLLAADVDGENGINVIDASLIRRYTVKLINAFPKEAMSDLSN